MKKAIITTLGMVGKDRDGKFNEANYRFDKSIIDIDKDLKYVNIFPLFIELLSVHYDIIPLYTDESLQRQRETLEFHKIDFDIEKNGRRIDENDTNSIFEIINKIMEDEQYDEFIVDVTHGFRSIPILTTVNMIITNFQDNKKIKHIIYAEEDFSNKGNYLIKDLIEYLDIANMAFILTTFEKNYTVSSHIKSDKYKPLIDTMNDFSNDIMALNLNSLFTISSKALIHALEQVHDIAISSQAKELKQTIEELTTYKGKKYYQTYFDLSKDLYEKNYMLLSLTLLHESARFYIRTYIKSKHKNIVQSIEDRLRDDYRINQFFKNLKNKSSKGNKQGIKISSEQYHILKNSFPQGMKKLYENIDRTRNQLAHADSAATFKDIHDNIHKLIIQYEKLITST